MYSLSNAVIRPLTHREINCAQEWAISEGWNPGPCDPFVFEMADPGSLLTMELHGRLVGAISAVRFSPGFGHLGFFVVAPSYRRSAHAWHLLQAGFERLGNRTIGGDGVPEHVRAYSRAGLQPHHITVSHTGVAPTSARPWQPGIQLLADSCVEKLLAYDMKSTGFSRAAFLKAWITLPASLALGFYREGRLCGFGVARRCHQGVRIGPLQADDPEAAEALFDALAGFALGEKIAIDCPETNPDAARLARKNGMIPGATTVRLYRGQPPADRPERIYSLMSFSLG
jgi:hypothetical protein